MSAIATPAGGLVNLHVPCRGCGYDLFASNRDGRCPECGQDVQPSVVQASVLHDPANASRARTMAALFLTSSIFAGLCPGACALALSLENELGPLLMSAAFAGCVISAIRGEYQRRSIHVGSGARMAAAPFVADLLAASGLLLINLGGYLLVYLHIALIGSSDSAERAVAATLAVGFFLLFVTAWRAVPAWRAHAELAQFTRGGKLEKFLKFMGWTKAIYETAWLLTCWTPLAMYAIGGHDFEDPGLFMAFGALFGLVGFAAIWLLMIIAHTILLVQIRRATAIALRR